MIMKIIVSGHINKGQMATLLKKNEPPKAFRVTKLIGFYRLDHPEVDSAKAGDIVGIAGAENPFVGDTVAGLEGGAVFAQPLDHVFELLVNHHCGLDQDDDREHHQNRNSHQHVVHQRSPSVPVGLTLIDRLFFSTIVTMVPLVMA